jgi:hypothetical protein
MSGNAGMLPRKSYALLQRNCRRSVVAVFMFENGDKKKEKFSAL